MQKQAQVIIAWILKDAASSKITQYREPLARECLVKLNWVKGKVTFSSWPSRYSKMAMAALNNK